MASLSQTFIRAAFFSCATLFPTQVNEGGGRVGQGITACAQKLASLISSQIDQNVVISASTYKRIAGGDIDKEVKQGGAYGCGIVDGKIEFVTRITSGDGEGLYKRPDCSILDGEEKISSYVAVIRINNNDNSGTTGTIDTVTTYPSKEDEDEYCHWTISKNYVVDGVSPLPWGYEGFYLAVVKAREEINEALRDAAAKRNAAVLLDTHLVPH